ncbi:PREDICTED: retinoic acid receptor responder protein 2 [Gekko japonicus]|uniref:Retinoic acid receptor responder protein 2 n=1 Tax=Gekko japonicus TaxID=146911 RepID=A0ABM1K406_GEKJA|nr:PREDICTED: retinoic acid receptor responder protein 2 [Gekko japonicus]
MKRLLVLCGGLLALAGVAPVPLQNRALEMVLDEFHNKTHVHFVFKQQAVVESVETQLQMGTFVQLEVDLVQTPCRKSQRGTQNCRIKTGGRKQKCLACFKFDSSENMLDKSVRCLSQQVPFFQEVRKKQARECEQVRMEGEEYYRPGVFAFSRGLPVGSS